MTLNRSYVAELEYIIREVLLPAYVLHYGRPPELPPGLLTDITQVRKECALFKPKNSNLN